MCNKQEWAHKKSPTKQKRLELGTQSLEAKQSKERASRGGSSTNESNYTCDVHLMPSMMIRGIHRLPRIIQAQANCKDLKRGSYSEHHFHVSQIAYLHTWICAIARNRTPNYESIDKWCFDKNVFRSVANDKISYFFVSLCVCVCVGGKPACHVLLLHGKCHFQSIFIMDLTMID